MKHRKSDAGVPHHLQWFESHALKGQVIYITYGSRQNAHGAVPLETSSCFDSNGKPFSVNTARALHAGGLPEIQYRTRSLIVQQ